MSASFNYSKEAKRPLLEEVTVQHWTVQRACSRGVKEAGVPVGNAERNEWSGLSMTQVGDRNKTEMGTWRLR